MALSLVVRASKTLPSTLGTGGRESQNFSNPVSLCVPRKLLNLWLFLCEADFYLALNC